MTRRRSPATHWQGRRKSLGFAHAARAIGERRGGTMRVRFFGTRGSIATPGPTTLRFGGNTSCVEVRSNCGTLVVLDMGTGAAVLGRELMDRGGPLSGHVLISHTHWDHIQ